MCAQYSPEPEPEPHVHVFEPTTEVCDMFSKPCKQGCLHSSSPNNKKHKHTPHTTFQNIDIKSEMLAELAKFPELHHQCTIKFSWYLSSKA